MIRPPPISPLFPYPPLFRSGFFLFSPGGVFFDPPHPAGAAGTLVHSAPVRRRARQRPRRHVPLCPARPPPPTVLNGAVRVLGLPSTTRSEEHTSELQSQSNLVCRLLLEKKKT